MNAAFVPILNELKQQRIDILNHVQNLSVEKFNYAPTGKWSISQILTHIITAEQLTLGYMKKKALGLDQLQNSGLSASLRLELLKISQRTPLFKFKAPKIVVRNTPPAYSLGDIQKRWEEHHQDLQAFLENIGDENTKKLVYKHPIAGRFNVQQAMVFSREHINHHWPQIKRLLD